MGDRWKHRYKATTLARHAPWTGAEATSHQRQRQLSLSALCPLSLSSSDLAQDEQPSTVASDLLQFLWPSSSLLTLSLPELLADPQLSDSLDLDLFVSPLAPPRSLLRATVSTADSQLFETTVFIPTRLVRHRNRARCRRRAVRADSKRTSGCIDRGIPCVSEPRGPAAPEPS